jgi:uncharacterized damage-inducible protein DinB
VENLTSKDLQQTLSYVNSSGVAYQAPLWLLLGHLVNHGTHHRAELSAIFTAFGIAHRENDMYYHYLIQSGQMDE